MIKNSGGAKLRLAELLIAGVLAMLVIVVFFSEKEAFEDLALGEETLRYYASHENYSIHADQLTKEELQSIRSGWKERGKRPVLLYLGNSQTHGINQKKEKDVSCNHLLFNYFESQGVDVITHSLPNANFQEFLLLYDFWKQELPVKYLILPAFMDDMRETGIRSSLVENIKSQQQYRFSDSSAIGKKINLAVYPVASAGAGDLAALNETIQEKTESYLNNWLDEEVPAWSNRPNVRGHFFRTLYNSRNSLFGINAQTKRKMIPQTYEDNRAAIEAIFQTTEKEEVATLFYIPPVRMDVESPYIQAEYEGFKHDMESLAEEYQQVTFYSFEAIVEGKYWGMKRSTNTSGEKEYDFMHFQYTGHEKLAKAMIPILEEMLVASQAPELSTQAFEPK